jgi:hypothetical protein
MTNVSDTSSNRRDQIANFAEILLNAPARQNVFKAIYRGKNAAKTIGEIAKATGYSTKRVATIAGPLAHGEKLFEQARERRDGRVTTVYKKIPFVARNKAEILSNAKSRHALDRYHTKTNPKIWPAPGSEDTELGVFMEPEVSHGETEVYPRVQA